MKLETIDVLGSEVPNNLWGRSTLLLQLLAHQGLLPGVLHLYAHQTEIGECYAINGNDVGQTESEVTSSIWKMAENFKNHGYLFE